jgi:outer membrane immunogenic protein
VKTIIKSLAALFALTSAAAAADLPYRQPAPAPYVASHSWSGFYVGMQGGYAFSGRNTVDNSAILGITDSFSTNGAFGGLTVGANLQVGNVVFGIEADGSLAHISDSFTQNRVTANLNTTAFGTARLRLGYDFNGLMPYVTGGFYGQRSKANISGFGLGSSASDTSFGWTAGAGVEYAFTNNWSVKGEYLYARTGQQNYTFPVFGLGGIGVGAGVDGHQQLFRLGVNYKL